MNQQGVSSGLYDEIRDYAELIDEVLVGLKARTSSPQDESRVRLAEFLEQLAGQAGDLSTRLIRLLLRGESQLEAPRLAKIGKVLLANPDDDSVIAPLERLATLLEQERMNAAARMRGSMR